ncbi:secreted protein [marine sediment metagenome]|uniref:Secreted protein n=1 Tax=marine sediment metagenome TaxID=412755 RepID=A0A1B6NT94_9ZZZZ
MTLSAAHKSSISAMLGSTLPLGAESGAFKDSRIEVTESFKRLPSISSHE